MVGWIQPQMFYVTELKDNFPMLASLRLDSAPDVLCDGTMYVSIGFPIFQRLDSAPDVLCDGTPNFLAMKGAACGLDSAPDVLCDGT